MLSFTRSRNGRQARRPATRAGRIRVIFILVFFAVAAAALGILLVSSASPTAQAAPDTTTPLRLYGEAKSQVDTLTGQAGIVQAQINALDDQLELASENYNQLQVKLDQLNVRMGDLRRQLTDAQVNHDRSLKKFEDRIRGVYKAGGRDQLLQMLLLADGIDDLFNRIRVISKLADQDNKLVDNLRESTDKLDGLLREIDQHKAEELTIRAQMGDQRAEIEAKLTDRKNALANIDSQISQVLENERLRRQTEQERLKQSLAGLLNGGPYAPPVPLTGDPILDQFVQTAAYYMGIPYVWAGDRPSTGFDCSGFTQFVYAQHGISLPHYSGYQAQMGMPVDPTKGLQVGDLLAFGIPVHHVGIYIGNGMFINSPRTGDVVKIEPLSGRSNLSAVRRFNLQPRVGPPLVR